jgi:hypothetical protein
MLLRERGKQGSINEMFDSSSMVSLQFHLDDYARIKSNKK